MTGKQHVYKFKKVENPFSEAWIKFPGDYVMIDRLFAWMTYKPVIGLMMIIGAIVLFIISYKKKAETEPVSFWSWSKIIIESACIAILFLGLLWAFRAILNTNLNNFRSTHGRVSEANYSSVKRIWGTPHVQKELQVKNYIYKIIKEEIPREDPGKPPLYKIVNKKVLVEQNSILNSNCEITLKLNKRKKGSAYYNGYNSTFYIEYGIINDSKHVTEAKFEFPLTNNQMLYENFQIQENSIDISKDLRFSSGKIIWENQMRPFEKRKITISYESRGLEYFYYQVPYPRQINKFYLKLVIDKLPVSEVNYPDGCLTPKKVSETKDGKGTVLEWKLDRAITTAGMGVSLQKPEQLGAKVVLVLFNSPYALMLLIVSICLTFLILGEQINFLEISLLSAVYCLLFITMASISDYFMGFWGSLIIGAGLTLGLSYYLYRNHKSKIIRNIIFSLVGFFTLIYPLSGIFPDFQESFNGLVIIGIIVFIFCISLYSRLKES